MSKPLKLGGSSMRGTIDNQIDTALGRSFAPDVALRTASPASLPAWFAVSDLAVASVGAAARELAGMLGLRDVEIDVRRTLVWFGMTLRPDGWAVPDAWDPIAGDYEAQDGWVKLHTNAPHHRDAALSVLGCAAERDAVGEAVQRWRKSDLEDAVVSAGGAAAAMRSLSEWAEHPQGIAVSKEPVIAWRTKSSGVAPKDLDGLRVLDLTRVLAGPVATRFLAGFGASVLRIDPPGWNEPGLEPEVTLGKKLAGLDLRRSDDRTTFEGLLGQADVLVHGYRPGALAGLGYDGDRLRALAPDMIEVALDAYGWSGPWAGRRGFDSLVQMSSGIADAGMARSGAERPVPLPVQALDHATGYLMAAAALRALRILRDRGEVVSARMSLARTAQLLVSAGPTDRLEDLAPIEDGDLVSEATGWGPARRVQFPVVIGGRQPRWPHPARPLRTDPAGW